MKAKPDRTLDCLGLYCPEPIYRTRMELDNMKIGADIKSLAKRLEQEIVSVRKDENTYRILVKKVK